MYMQPVNNRKAERYQLSELDCIITRSSRKINVIYQKRSDNATVILTTKQCLNNRMMEHMYQVKKKKRKLQKQGLVKIGRYEKHSPDYKIYRVWQRQIPWKVLSSRMGKAK